MKILYFDLETMSINGDAWRRFDTNLIRVIRDWQIICFSYKWEGDKKVSFVKPDDKDPFNDKEMIKTLWNLFDEADIIIAHNLNRFDVKKSNAMFLRRGFPPPSPYKKIDTLQVARSNFGLTSNKLDDLGEMLGIGVKVKHEGFMKLQDECMLNNSSKYWKKMKKYNDQDVNLLQKLYKILRPWVRNHPINTSNIDGCPKCHSKSFQKRGFNSLGIYKYQRYRCNNCSGWFSDRKSIKTDKPKFKNA